MAIFAPVSWRGIPHISPRQLERLFAQHIGVSPKGFASLVRYQSLWREAVFSSHFDVLDAVERYGYVDQAHLLNSFKQFHSLSLRDALAKARQNVMVFTSRRAIDLISLFHLSHGGMKHETYRECI